MRWKPFALWILATAYATGEIAAADAPTNSPMFRQWIIQQSRFSLVGGRVVSNCISGMWMFGRPPQVMTQGQIREEIQFNGNGITGALVYTYQRNAAKTGEPKDPKDPRIECVLDISSEGRFILRYSDKDQPEKYFEFTQLPGQPIRLSLAPADKPRVLRAPSIWQLLIIDREDCGKEFLPLLESIRGDWRLARAAQSAEDELVKMAAVSRKSDRKQWEAWVDQLNAPLWTQRNRADQNLRNVGPALLGYLNRLDMSQLDAEQKSRLRRITRDLSTQTGEDTPEHVASMLIQDPLVWLALLSRGDESTRQAAVQQLAVILNVPIAIDPKAEPNSQAKAREELRKQIEKTVGEDSKPGDAPKPAAGSKKG